MSNENTVQHYIEVTSNDLPLTCPMPGTSLWNAHPRVRISINHGGEARCPYCGMLYKFKGEPPKAHH